MQWVLKQVIGGIGDNTLGQGIKGQNDVALTPFMWTQKLSVQAKRQINYIKYEVKNKTA